MNGGNMEKIRFAFLSRRFSDDTRLARISRGDNAYLFFHNEYTLGEESNGNFFVTYPKEKLKRIRKYLISRRVEKGNRFYNYLRTEYRQNALMEDSFGNILLSDEVCRTMADESYQKVR